MSDVNILAYRGWGDNGLGVFGHAVGTDFSWEVSQLDTSIPANLLNGFSQAGTGFVFRGDNTSGTNDTLVYSSGTSAGTFAILNDTAGNLVTDPNAFAAFGSETVFFAQTASVPGLTTVNQALMITNGAGAPETLLPFAVSDYRIVGDSLYATASNRDLYRVGLDGQSQLILDADATGSTLITDYTFEFEGALHFRAHFGNLEHRFYRVDPGTGSVVVLDGAVDPGGSDDVILPTNGIGDTQFFFWNFASATGTELYVSDGTAAGTQFVADIRPGTLSSYRSDGLPYAQTLGDKFFFLADDGGSSDEEFWISDGTAGGTFALTGPTVAGSAGDLSASNLAPGSLVVGNNVFFTAFRADVGRELFVSDGTIAGTRLVKDINPGSDHSSPTNFATDGTYLYFSTAGEEAVWRSDGTEAGTVLISDPFSGDGSNQPTLMSVLTLDSNALPVRTINGGSLVDQLTGSGLREIINGFASNDVLSGLGGNDTLYGGAGNDWMVGGAEADQLVGGSETDTAAYNSSGAGVTVNLNTGTGSGGHAQGDVLSEIENIYGSNFVDTLTGNSGANALYGIGGNDVLSGLGGNDTLYGGAGNDWMVGGAGADRFFGGSQTDTAAYNTSGAGVTVNLNTGTGSGGDAQGDFLSEIENIYGSNFVDTLTGNAGANALYGINGNDVLSGLGGNDTLYGGAGNDWMVGGAGADRFFGGSEIDTAAYNSSGAGVTVNLNTGTGSGGDAQGDFLSEIENIYGSNFVDTLTGNGGANTLYGINGNDVLSGLGGNDSLYGGAGNDTTLGGAGNDVIWMGAGDDTHDFRNGDGVDTLRDFVAGGVEDRIDLSSYTGLGLTSFAQLQASGRLSTVNGHAELSLNGGDRIILLNVSSHLSLTAGDFSFT